MSDDKKPWAPTWLYRLVDNKVEAVCFEGGPPENMKDWSDAPPAPKKRGRPPKQPEQPETEE